MRGGGGIGWKKRHNNFGKGFIEIKVRKKGGTGLVGGV